ncbi:TIGR01777 family oxidoreductase [Kangiella sediminilitoris]|uniref:Cell division inhibitor n=1 Tax=Kangiella sediminilitoris TaxID=1144748 RepID=A0A1B3B9U6_9GAMM|nr:TIGR01777 family oxidoreductase [Kangiella sediminilitoris]AOE49580.1 Cell division inhibitor [Kangiella sediminilitoris]
MSQVLITGGTGFIGRNLIPLLQAKGYKVTVLTRSADKYKAYPVLKEVRLVESLQDVNDIDVVVNLAGANLAAKRWSDSYKETIVNSRLNTTENLLEWIKQQEHKPHTLINGSAIGFYGARGNEELDESSTSGNGSEFQVRLCTRWEDAAYRAENLGLRVCCIRTGVVLGHEGALQQMLPPFKFGLGGKLGSGNQYFSWIHISDHVRAVMYLIKHSELQGAFNLTAPEPVTNYGLTKTLGKVLGRPTFATVPEFALKLLVGELAKMLLTGQRVYPKKLMESGFTFEYPTLNEALQDLLN